ncbi:hypothetical protein [Pseudocolwellia agarivorans]|uniref:hypothetical protein n=1 Tax=Pseudocolwellia agarivorans TaxID=1911682 RepID=UPI000986B452|nr:hypothetical protein [Pseudocolwellia agarivorans]
MDITKLFFNARQRNAWQVFDLTQLVVKHHFIQLMLIVVCVYLPIAILFSVIFSVSTASFIIWWLKPILERPLLDFLAKRSFYQPTSTWSSILSIKKLKVIDIISMLTIRRLSPYRSYLASIEQLELLQGSERKKRKNILLNRNDHKQMFWLIFCVHIELIIATLLMVVVYNFIPQGVSIDDQFFTSGTALYQLELLYSCCYIAAVMLLTPYYVTGGFLGYLNSRIDMEGWDLELTFKGIAARFRQIAVVLVIGILSFSLPTPPLSAQEVTTEQTDKEKAEGIDEEAPLNARNIQIRKEVVDIYEQHQLIEKTNIWKPVVDPEESKFDFEWLKSFFSGLSVISNVIAYLIWLLVATLIVWIAYKLYSSGGFKWLKFSAGNTKAIEGTVDLPTFLSSIDNSEGPKDLLKAAQQANNKQAYRTALMYLLKYSFIYAQNFSNVLITKSMSEKECEIALLKALPQLLHKNYQQLFHLWIQQAWAHKDVNQQQVDDVISAFKVMKPEQAQNE